MSLLSLFDLSVLDSAVRFATPLLLACLAGLFSERAGIFDIGLEGKMLFAAFFSAAVAALVTDWADCLLCDSTSVDDFPSVFIYCATRFGCVVACITSSYTRSSLGMVGTAQLGRG